MIYTKVNGENKLIQIYQIQTFSDESTLKSKTISISIEETGLKLISSGEGLLLQTIIIR